MFGADLIGFHTRFHCNNFLDTVDRVVEGADRLGATSESRAEPRRVDARYEPFFFLVAPTLIDEPPRHEPGAFELGIDLGVGVERMGYTKELREHCAHVHRFSAAPTRVRGRLNIRPARRPRAGAASPAVRDYNLSSPGGIDGELDERELAADRPPQESHHDHPRCTALLPLGRTSWMVTSLHDGMNPIAEGSSPSRDDGDGVLILSRFTGACRACATPILVNPYDADEWPRGDPPAPSKDDARRASEAAWRGCARGPCASTNIDRLGAPLLLGELARLQGQADLAD